MSTTTAQIQYHQRGVQAADEIERLTRERDEARAEVERLRDENATLRRDIDRMTRYRDAQRAAIKEPQP